MDNGAGFDSNVSSDVGGSVVDNDDFVGKGNRVEGLFDRFLRVVGEDDDSEHELSGEVNGDSADLFSLGTEDGFGGGVVDPNGDSFWG